MATERAGAQPECRVRPIPLDRELARGPVALARDAKHREGQAARRRALLGVDADAERAEDAADRLTLQQVLNDFLRAQTREARTYFIRRYWYGESISEIAAACRAGEGAARVSLFRTRNRPRKALEKGGIAL